MQTKQPRSDILYMTTLDTGRCSHIVSDYAWHDLSHAQDSSCYYHKPIRNPLLGSFDHGSHGNLSAGITGLPQDKEDWVLFTTLGAP